MSILPSNSRCLREWTLSSEGILEMEKTVRLLRSENKLSYEVIGLGNRVRNKGIIPSSGDLDKLISTFSRLEVVLDKGDHAIFAQPCGKWNLVDKVVWLLPVRNNLVWQIFDSIHGTCTQTPFVPSTETNVCSEDAINFINDLPHLSPLECGIACKKLNVYCKELNSISSTWKVGMIPISAKSRFDPEVNISPFMWAVTLIGTKGKTGLHAEIVIEGVNNKNKYFFRYV